MRLLLGILVIGSALWGGYWFIGERTVEAEITRWLDQASNQQLEVGYQGINTTGFPNRFDTTVAEPWFVDHRNGFGWSAPFLKIFALSYKPNHIVAVLPHEQTLRLGDTEMYLQNEDMRASLKVDPNSDLTLDQLRLSADALTLNVAATDIDIARVFLATRRAVAQTAALDVAVKVSNLDLSDDVQRLLDPSLTLPNVIDGLEMETTIQFSDDIGLRGKPPRMVRLLIDKARLSWGELSLSLRGDVQTDTQGFAAGTLTLEAKNWRQVFAVLSRAGVVDQIWEGAIAPLAEADGNPRDLSAPLTLNNGLIYFGPLPLGPAPKLN